MAVSPKVRIEYFKPSGKFYTEHVFSWGGEESMHSISTWLKGQFERGSAPGMSAYDPTFTAYVYVDGDYDWNYPVIIPPVEMQAQMHERKFTVFVDTDKYARPGYNHTVHIKTKHNHNILPAMSVNELRRLAADILKYTEVECHG